MRRLLGLLACLGTVGCATTGIPVPAPEPLPTLNADNAPEWLREATVTLVRGHHRPFCTGAVTLKANLILTAAHCVPEEGRIHVRLHDRRVVHAQIVAHDAARDVAVLRTRHPLPIQPLPLAPTAVTARAETALFLGMPRHHRPIQRTQVRMDGRCPRLPTLQMVLRSDYEGRPGDSGAPLLSARGVVGIVSGGKMCRVAIPIEHATPLLQQAQAPPANT